MHAHTELRLAAVQERIARAHRHAEGTRLATEAHHRQRPSLRRSVGRSIIAIGERLASEPTLERVRAR